MISNFLGSLVTLSEWWDDTTEGRMAKYWAAEEMAMRICKETFAEFYENDEEEMHIFWKPKYVVQLLKKEWFC